MSTTNAAGIALGWLADHLWGDPRRLHPVAGFGQTAARVEAIVWRDSRLVGTVHAVGLVGAVIGICAVVDRTVARMPMKRVLFTAMATWTALGGASLRREAAAMQVLVAAGDLEGGRACLSHLCGRDAARLDGMGLTRATIESVAENTSDAVVAPLVWGAVGGAPALMGYRALNTLDAMIGYRTSRHERFGWAAARLDDVANWIPARITALLTAIAAPVVGGTQSMAMKTWRHEGAAHPSPNAGPVEAAFAGALGVRLGGATNNYGDHSDTRPSMGPDVGVAPDDIPRVCDLSFAVEFLAVAAAVVVAVLPRVPALRRPMSGRFPASATR